MSAYSLDLREKIVESVKQAVPKAETARRFGVDRATVKRYCKQLDERGSLEPRKAPGRAPKLDEKAKRLLLEDLERRPWATHSQRAEFLFAVCGVRVSEATVCRTLRRRLSHSRKKDQGGARTRRVPEATVAHGAGAWSSGASIPSACNSWTRWAPTPPWLPRMPTHPWASVPPPWRSLGTLRHEHTTLLLRVSMLEGWDHLLWP